MVLVIIINLSAFIVVSQNLQLAILSVRRSPADCWQGTNSRALRTSGSTPAVRPRILASVEDLNAASVSIPENCECTAAKIHFVADRHSSTSMSGVPEMSSSSSCSLSYIRCVRSSRERRIERNSRWRQGPSG